MIDLHMSTAGRQMLAGFEGKRNRAYQDIRGIWTCGIGCTGPDIGPDTYWTDAEVDQHFADRLAREFEPAVNQLCSDTPTTQGQFDALVSLAFNIGTGDVQHRVHQGGLATSSVIREHLAGNYDAAADDFLLWDHVNGEENEALAARRAKEGQLYLDSSPGQGP